MTDASARDLQAFGRRVRDRREQLGLSVRTLATRAGISPSYVTAIELGRNASTGRPPVPSIHVVGRLAAELDLDVPSVVQAIGTVGSSRSTDEHVLVYGLGEPRGSLLRRIDDLFGADVDHWLYVADPRATAIDALGDRATIAQWPLGAFPYESRYLEPDAIVAALDGVVRTLAARHAKRRVGLAIADCSAVMRWVHNAATEVDLERTWHDQVHRIWREHLGIAPAIDVCAYLHDDIEALGLNLDQAATALQLIRHHDRVVVLKGDDVVTDAPAIRRILERVRPAGVSTSAWSDLTAAAAETLAVRA